MASSQPADAGQKFCTLSATYKSPTNEAFVHAHKIPAPPSAQTTDRTSYLAALRKATAALQESINTDLTARMEEDKAREGATDGAKHAKQGVDEAKEEDNYGEEVVEEDD